MYHAHGTSGVFQVDKRKRHRCLDVLQAVYYNAADVLKCKQTEVWINIIKYPQFMQFITFFRGWIYNYYYSNNTKKKKVCTLNQEANN